MADVALGIVPHSGWAVVVGVTAPPVRLVLRERIEILGDGDPAQPWHLAQHEGMSPDDASALASTVAEGANLAARVAIRGIADAVRAEGHRPTAVAIVGEPREVPPADVVLRNHMLLHAAEGELFREALAGAATRAGLDVLVVPPKSLDLGPLEATLADLGRAAGPPWRVDHRRGVVAALTAL